MNKLWLVLLGIAVAVGILSVGMYNNLVNAREKVDNQWAQVQSQYQRRFDLIPNLVETVKGVATQEQTVFGDIAEARTRYSGAQSSEDRVNAANQLESALSRLLVIVENYPQLKSQENFMTLMSQLEGTENRISVERQRYNDTVRDYNLIVRKFPGNLMAGLFGFNDKSYFEAAAGADQAPQVDFN